MADALASGASVLRDVGVQVPLRPPNVLNRVIKAGRSVVVAGPEHVEKGLGDLRGITGIFAALVRRQGEELAQPGLCLWICG